jgi:putative DNA primase/helicase
MTDRIQLASRQRPYLDAKVVRRSASGRWPELLQSLGIPASVLSNKRNQPCPACGGRDRFVFIDKGAGRFVCRALDGQGGDGFALVEHWLDCNFHSALAVIADALGVSECPGPSFILPAPRKAFSAVPALPRDAHLKLVSLWDGATGVSSENPAGQYLSVRGLAGVLQHCPEALRYASQLPYWHQGEGHKLMLLGKFPALLARLTSPDGELAGIHRIYLSAFGQKQDLYHADEQLPAKKLVTVREGASNGAAIQLYPVTDGRLALAECIETALAVRLGSGLPAWACVSAGGLTRVQLPPEAVDVWIFADHDVSGTGQQAAERLARRLRMEGRQVRILFPEQSGCDWLDVLNELNQQEEHERSAA